MSVSVAWLRITRHMRQLERLFFYSYRDDAKHKDVLMEMSYLVTDPYKRPLQKYKVMKEGEGVEFKGEKEKKMQMQSGKGVGERKKRSKRLRQLQPQRGSRFGAEGKIIESSPLFGFSVCVGGENG